MSYILEALADSEQARQQIATAPKYSLLPAIGEEPGPQRRWPYVLVGAVLLNAALLQLWLRPALPGGAAPSNAAAVPQVTQAAQAASARSMTPSLARSERPAAEQPRIALREAGPPQSRPQPVEERQFARPAAPLAPVAAVASANPASNHAAMPGPAKPAPRAKAQRAAEAARAGAPQPAPTPAPAMAGTPTQATAPAPAIANPVNKAATPEPPMAGTANQALAPATPKQAGATAELPPALQRELPALSVAGFIHEASGSMVIVNDRLMREGDEVAPGVKLETIINDSLVFNYKGYRFKR